MRASRTTLPASHQERGRCDRGSDVRRALLLALALLAAIVGGFAPSAKASGASQARFVYELCDSALPGGADPQLNLAVNPGVPIGYFDSCASPGGSVGLTQWGHTTSAFAYLTVDVPATPGGFIEAVTISGGASNLGPGNDHSFIYEQPWPQNNAGETSRTFFIRREPSLFLDGSFDLLMNCNGNYAPGCEAGPTLWAHDIAATEVDPNPPKLTQLEGSLLSGGMLRGHQTLEAEATDIGGGVSAITVLVDGLPVGDPAEGNCRLAAVANKSYTGKVALSPSPCPPALKTNWMIDTQRYPFHNGANTVQVCGSDLATIGNPNTTCSTQKISVDNSCIASSVPGGEVLSAQFAQSNRETLTVGYRENADVVGQLRTNAGDPVPGATLCVKMLTLGIGSETAGVGSIQTDARGHYRYSVPAGPNRDVEIGYRHDSHQIVRDVRYYARAKPMFKLGPSALHNGQRVHFWGHLPGPSPGRRVVIIQANAIGSTRWITFRKATTTENGEFASGYRFTSTTRSTRYRFRALVPRQAGYPWVQGHSRPATVLVKG